MLADFFREEYAEGSRPVLSQFKGLEIRRFHVFQERRAADLEAQMLWKGRLG